MKGEWCCCCTFQEWHLPSFPPGSGINAGLASGGGWSGGEEEKQSEEGKRALVGYSLFSVSGVFYGCKRVLLTGAVPSGSLLGLPV